MLDFGKAGWTREQLYEEARGMNGMGRSTMTRDQLRRGGREVEVARTAILGR